MASLAGSTPASTFRALLKTDDNNVVGASLVQVTDGLGNGIPMAVSTTAVSMSSAIITGSLLGNASTATTASNALTASLAVTASNALTASSVTALTQNVLITGSLTVTGSTLFKGTHTLSGSNTITGNTVMSGSIEVSGSSNFRNSTFIVTGSSYFKGTHEVSGSTDVTGSLNVTGNFNIISGSGFYRWGNLMFNYGNFYSTQSQSNPVGNVSRSLFIETDAGSSGVSIANQTRITVANSGLYNLQFSTQFEKTNNGTDQIYIWFKKNGVNVPDSATSIDITRSGGTGGKLVAAWNFLIPLSGSDYLEIVWQSADTSVSTAYVAGSGNIPNIPSTIATLTQIA